MIIRKICVFCGSNTGIKQKFSESAQNLAKILVDNDIALVYGGAKIGLMGILADSVLQAGGKVTGVMPKTLIDKEAAHEKLTELYIVESMHQRKALMAELADGFIMLPGGTGTLDEFFEIVTWSELGFHHKPYGILNIEHYYDDLLKFLDHAMAMQFINYPHRKMIMMEESPEKLLQQFQTYKARSVNKWAIITEADSESSL